MSPTVASDGVRRITLPFLLDVVFVSGADAIRDIEASGDAGRLHSFPSSSLPGWVRLLFAATRFRDDLRDRWFLPMEPASDPSYLTRRELLTSKAADGYTPQDVAGIAKLLRENASDEALAHAMVQIVNRRFLGAEVPMDVCRAAGRTLNDFGGAAVPGRYSKAKLAQRTVAEYCASRLPEGAHALDVAHNIGEIVLTTAPALRTLARNPDVPVERLFTLHPLTPQVPRIAVKKTTFGGLLGRPAVPGRTVIIYKIGKAAAETGDLDFTFGAGGPDRQCIFRNFFLGFMRDLQSELRTHRA